jgi:CHAT domain-containing protein/tetratricopeptide (TPR) repeat protein
MSSRFCGNLLGVAARLAVTALCVVGGSASASGDARGGARGEAGGPRELIAEARRAYEVRQVDRAEALFRDALTLAEAGGVPLAREQAEALLGIGRIELEGDRRTAAKASLDRAVALFETAGDASGHAQALAASGQGWVLLGDGAEGVRRVQTAVDTLREKGEVEGLSRASAILMSVMPPGPGKDRARDAAFAAARASASRGHECSIRHSWGGDLMRAGEYAEAWRVLTEAVTCFEGVPNDRRLTNALISIGSLKRTHGQFDAALAAFERAVTVGRERHDPVGTVIALSAVATAQTDLWRVDEARASLEAALKLARERKMEMLTPFSVGQLGAHLTQIGQFAAAIPLLEESLAQAVTVPRQIERLTQLCAARARAAGVGVDGARAALPVCDRNVTLARGDSPTALLYALRARAEARRRAGEVGPASADLREAVELVEDLRGKTVPIDFMKRGFSAWHEWLFGSSIALSEQQRDVRQALETAERARARALLDLLATREVNAQPATALAAARSAAGADAPRAPGAAPPSAATSGPVTSDVAPPGLAPAGAAAPAASAASIDARKAPATSGDATSGAVTSDVAARGAATADARRAVGDLPRVESSEAVRAATVPDMVATARRLQSTLLVYWVVPDAVYIWTIAPDGAIHDARVEVPMERVVGLVASTRAPASQDAAGGLFALKASSSRRPWRELHDLLITPVRAYLPKTADALVTIVPHGPLAQLSFAALQDEQGSYLLERYTLHYTPAVGVLAYTAKRQEERHQRYKQAASVSVSVSASTSTSTSTSTGTGTGTGTGNGSTRGSANGNGNGSGSADTRATTALLVGDPGELPAVGVGGTPLSALPWARKEVTEVAALLGNGATVLTDEDATEAAVRARLPGRSLLHFATHGVVREDETLGSFLALRGGPAPPAPAPPAPAPATPAAAAPPAAPAPATPAAAAPAPGATTSSRAASASATGSASTPAAESDGRLTADEVYELSLDADLVVLSACSSALGPTGTEGVIGFTRAFLYAGAASVVATSWNVPDASSYELMSRFYREREREQGRARRDTPATARALRAAQLSTLAALRQGKVTITTPDGLNGRGTPVALPDHPLFWAGFIVVGEP